MRTVLVVDDEPLAAEELCEALDLAGIPSVFAIDPLDALAHAADPAIGIVVTDLKMPTMSGSILMDRLRGMRPDLAFVIVTGHGAPSPDEAEPQGVLCQLRKPVDPARLVALLQGWQAKDADHGE
jgi:DNA-binding NtrC family response regulator